MLKVEVSFLKKYQNDASTKTMLVLLQTKQGNSAPRTERSESITR